MRKTMWRIIVTFVVCSIMACTSSQSNVKGGIQYYIQGDYDRAIIELEKASRNDTDIHDRIDAYEYLGKTYTRQGNLEKAVQSYRSAHRLMRQRIGELIDQMKKLKSDHRFDSALGNYKAQGRARKLNDEYAKLSARAEEMLVKIQSLQ